MKRIKRIVDTGFWSDAKVMEFSPEDKYFWLFLLTNEYTSQLGVYYLPIKKAAFDLGYSEETVRTLLFRFEVDYQMIRFSDKTDEVAIKNYLMYSVVKGGKPVLDCLKKETQAVKDKELLVYIYTNLSNKDIKNNTILEFIDYLNIYINDNDNERYVDESWTNRPETSKKPEKSTPLRNQIPPTLEMVSEYVAGRKVKIDPQTFIDFYSSKGWKIGKNRMVDWQAAVRTWENKHKTNSTDPHRFV